MNAKQIASKVNRHYRKENGFPMTENGYRVRVTKDAQELGNDVVELGASYFYTSQAHIEYAVESFVECAAAAGLTVKLEAIDTVYFNTQPWPKDSWATQHYRITVVEG